MSVFAYDERLARRVGAIALLGIGAAIAGFLFVRDGVALGSPIRIRVMFRHTGGLREHAALVVAGQPVGRIEAIAAVPHAAGGPLGGEAGIAATVAIDDRDAWKVPAAAEIFVASRGPLSDRYLEVAPPVGEPGPSIRDGQELRGVDPPSLDNAIQRAWTNMLTYQAFVAAVRPELDALRAQVSELGRQLDAVAPADTIGSGVAALVTSARELTAAARSAYDAPLGGDAGVARLRAMLQTARATVVEIRAAADVLGPRAQAITADLARVRGGLSTADPVVRAEQILATVRAQLDKLDPLLATASELADRLARGEGSLGRLMTDPEFSDDAKDLGKVIKRHPWRVLERPKD